MKYTINGENFQMKKIILTIQSVILFLGFLGVSNVFAFDHSHKDYDVILKKYVANGKVAYTELAKDSSLKSYLDSLSSIQLADYNGYSKEQKLSFLINAYNAFTLKIIIDHYPLKSIKKIGFLPGAAWKKKFFKLLGEERNLDWIEHEKLRKDFDEPRIHFTIVCASIGCPLLANEAYTPEKIERQMQTAYLLFLNDASKNRYEVAANTLYLSPIFDWFKVDFTRKGSLIQFVQPAYKINIREDAKILYTDYDWNLNDNPVR
jgi:hypothetical protein